MDKRGEQRIFFQKISCDSICCSYYIDDEKNEKIIDILKLKRNYLEKPIIIIKNGGRCYHDKPFKEDLNYLYIELLLPKEVIATFMNCHIHNISKWICDYKLKRDRKIIVEKMFETKLKKYGNKTYNNIDKMKETKLKRYGDSGYHNIDKMKETNLKKYGVEWTTIVPEVMKKIIETNLKKYGVRSTTCIPEIKKKQELTCLKHYGVINPSFSKEIIEKIYNIRKNNGTWSGSKEEDIIYNILLSKYKNIKRQYKSEKYPFACDFYIPEIDTYIEYQGSWTHGKEPYLGTSKQLEKVKLWESKNTRFYTSAIKTWTITDVLKRKIAKDNKLKYLEFFSIKDFNNWFIQL